ncbi:hypothetical protein GCM10010317_085850 [Streptomyces mirabilis]|nr:hypothetical protein GCM10010317_085850 [Streptomyces mirabilis]
MLGIPEDELKDRVDTHQILELTTSDGYAIYPDWQFRNGDLIQGWSAVLQSFQKVRASAWLIATWAQTPSKELNDLSPISWLRQSRATEKVVKYAESYAARWSR